MPRLPMPIARRDPRGKRPPRLEEASWRWTSRGISAMRRSGKFWRTRSRRGSSIPFILSLGLAALRFAGVRLAPLRFQHAGVFAGSIEVELEVDGGNRAVRLELHITAVERIGVAMIIAEELLSQ